jgi:hypothetical protein
MFQMVSYNKYQLDAFVFEWYASAHRVAAVNPFVAPDGSFGAVWMKLLGFFLLLAGWTLVIASVVMLGQGAPRAIFVLAGMGVEVVGLVLVARSHLVVRGGEWPLFRRWPSPIPPSSSVSPAFYSCRLPVPVFRSLT